MHITHGQNMTNLLMIDSCVHALGHSSCLHLLSPVNSACMVMDASSITFLLTLCHAHCSCMVVKHISRQRFNDFAMVV